MMLLHILFQTGALQLKFWHSSSWACCFALDALPQCSIIHYCRSHLYWNADNDRTIYFLFSLIPLTLRPSSLFALISLPSFLSLSPVPYFSSWFLSQHLFGLPSFYPSLIPLNSYLFLHSSSLLTKEIFFPSSHFPYPSTMNSLHSSFSHDLSPPSIFHHFSVLIHFPSSLSLFALHLFLSLHLYTLISLFLSLSPYPFLLSFPSSLTHLRSSF